MKPHSSNLLGVERVDNRQPIVFNDSMKSSTTFDVPSEMRHYKKKQRSGVTKRKYNRFTLRKDVLEWCKANCKKHWYLSEGDNSWSDTLKVHFYDADEAMLFKLTWL